MGFALDTISGSVVNPSTTRTAWTVNSGDSLTVRNYNLPASAYIIDANIMGAAAGTLQVKSPRMHDNLQGWLGKQIAANPLSIWPLGAKQLIYPQDALNVTQTGDAADTDLGSLLLFYQDLPGISARLFTADQIWPRVEHLVTIEATMTTAATKGIYSATVAMNGGANDVLIANRDYAIIGYGCDTASGRICFKGPDLGNLRVSGPASTDKIRTAQFFSDLSVKTGLPTIGVFNAANKASTLIDMTSNTTGTTVIVDAYLALLHQ